MIQNRTQACLRLLSIVLCLVLQQEAVAALSPETLQLKCPAGAPARLDCVYYTVTSDPIVNIKAQVNGQELPVSSKEAYPWKDATSALLLLVDTSDPAREPVIEQQKKHIAMLLSALKPHHHAGLASFDKTLRLDAPLGSTVDVINQAATQLHATGKTTELYRSVLSAIETLRAYEADRKTIILFSDGLAEDRAYFHDDVVRAARQSGITIIGLGYPRSVSQSVALQTIRRLSEETGAVYIDTGNNFSLSEDAATRIYNNIDSGGRFSIEVPAITVPGANDITLTLTTAADSYTVNVPLPEAAKSPAITAPPAPVGKEISTATATVAAPVQIINRETPARSFNVWIWYGIPAALIVVLVIILIAFLFTFYRQEKKAPPQTRGLPEYKPYAYLVIQDETKKRYPITRTSWRIGRGKDNEMTLPDSSVSRRHAEISRDKGDVFTLIDLDSLNGIYVNNKKVARHILHEGDIIEIGDIHLRFTLLSADYAIEEATAMQNTRAPVTH